MTQIVSDQVDGTPNCLAQWTGIINHTKDNKRMASGGALGAVEASNNQWRSRVCANKPPADLFHILEPQVMATRVGPEEPLERHSWALGAQSCRASLSPRRRLMKMLPWCSITHCAEAYRRARQPHRRTVRRHSGWVVAAQAGAGAKVARRQTRLGLEQSAGGCRRPPVSVERAMHQRCTLENRSTRVDVAAAV